MWCLMKSILNECVERNEMSKTKILYISKGNCCKIVHCIIVSLDMRINLAEAIKSEWTQQYQRKLITRVRRNQHVCLNLIQEPNTGISKFNEPKKRQMKSWKEEERQERMKKAMIEGRRQWIEENMKRKIWRHERNKAII